MTRILIHDLFKETNKQMMFSTNSENQEILYIKFIKLLTDRFLKI